MFILGHLEKLENNYIEFSSKSSKALFRKSIPQYTAELQATQVELHGSLMHRFFSIKTVQYCKCIFFHDFLKIFFSLT